MSMHIAAIQFEVGSEALIDENLERAMEQVRRLEEGVDVACFPEYFTTSYFPAEQDPAAFELAESDDGKLIEIVRQTARETETALIAPFFERGHEGDRYYNAAIVVGRNGDVVGKYRKLHPFQRPGYNESFYFAPGDLGAPVFDLGQITAGVMICYDRHFPEIARVQALRGADVVFVPTCSFGEENRDEVWVKELTGIAVANSVFVVGVNRAGEEKGMRHFGGTTLIAPDGEEIKTLSTQPDVISRQIDPDQVTETRRKTKHLNDIRDELLPDLERL
jgi:predicted amidohydrolase